MKKPIPGDVFPRSTVTRLAARLGRHALLLQALALQHLEMLEEPVVLDHFETFVS